MWLTGGLQTVMMLKLVPVLTFNAFSISLMKTFQTYFSPGLSAMHIILLILLLKAKRKLGVG